MIDNIIAVDFDGTLCKNRYPDIGEPIQEVIDKLLEEQKNGAKLILWTCRCDQELTDAVEWCGRHGIVFDAVNDHLQELKEAFGNNTRKIFAHQYWDDRAVNILKELGITTIKLADEGIINKVLEFCNKYRSCKGCPYYNHDANCINKLHSDAFAFNNRLKTENRYLRGKIKHLDEKLVIQKGLIDHQTARIEALQMDNNQLQSDIINANQNYEHIKEFVEKVIFEIVNKPSEFTAEQGTADFFSGSAHRQNEIIDIIEKMAVNCDDNNI